MSERDDGGEPSYGEAMDELETILAELERDDVDVDRLAERVARAATLIELCRTRIETARAIEAALPDRDQLGPGGTAGDIMDQRWRIDVTPFPRIDAAGKQPHPWVPEHVVLSIQSAEGGSLQIDTVRLRRRVGQ